MEKEAKLYELAYIISPILELEAAQNLNQALKNEVQDLGGFIEEEGEITKRRLGYEINKVKEAYLAHFKFTFAPEKIDDLKTKLSKKDILRYLLVSTERTPVRTAPHRVFESKSPEGASDESSAESMPAKEPEQPAANIEEIDKRLEEILGK